MHPPLDLRPLSTMLCLLLAGATTARAAPQQPTPDAPILLVGTVLTPSGPVDDGFVLIEEGLITSVSTVEPSHPGAVVLRTGSVIAPGSVDLHDHLSFDVLPRWEPDVLFRNKYQWREHLEYVLLVETPYGNLVSKSFCEMNTWGELRALVGGTTSVVAAALTAGVEVELAPDWAVTGSSNMLDELRFAATWNEDQLGGLLTDRQLVEMATSVPARIAGVDEFVGGTRAGLRADIVLIDRGDRSDPYRAMVDASAESVERTLVDGVSRHAIGLRVQ